LRAATSDANPQRSGAASPRHSDGTRKGRPIPNPRTPAPLEQGAAALEGQSARRTTEMVVPISGQDLGNARLLARTKFPAEAPRHQARHCGQPLVAVSEPDRRKDGRTEVRRLLRSVQTTKILERVMRNPTDRHRGSGAVPFPRLPKLKRGVSRALYLRAARRRIGPSTRIRYDLRGAKAIGQDSGTYRCVLRLPLRRRPQ
jgi:hypothetical protein